MAEPETMVFRFDNGQSLRASVEHEAPLYYSLRDTAGNPLVVSRDRVREIVPLADVEPCPDAFSGAATDPGHRWDGDACALCGKSRRAAASSPSPAAEIQCPGGGYHYPAVPCDGTCAAGDKQPEKPSRYSANPAQVDDYLRRGFTEEVVLNYQRAIGNRAVEEAAKDLRMQAARLESEGERTTPREYRDAADHIDPLKGGGHFPSVLLCGKHNGFGPCPGAPRCTPPAEAEVR